MIQSLRRITYGRTTIPESWMFAGGDENKKIPIILSVFLIETGDMKILVDAGCNTMPGFELTDFVPPRMALQAAGVMPEEITHLLLTHSHHDHADAAGDFPNAKIYVQQEEYAGAKKYLRSEAQVMTFDADCSVTEGVRIVKIGGHTAGSCVVECNWQGERYVLCGDECYGLHNLQKRVPTATSVCPENSQSFIEIYTTGDYHCLLCHQKEECL